MSIGLFAIDGGSSCHPSYDITAPFFDEITIHLHPDYYFGQKFKIIVHNQGENNHYIQRMTLNGKEQALPLLTHDDFQRGGTIHLWLGNTPEKK